MVAVLRNAMECIDMADQKMGDASTVKDAGPLLRSAYKDLSGLRTKLCCPDRDLEYVDEQWHEDGIARTN